MGYDAQKEAEKIARVLRISNETKIDYIKVQLEVAFTHGEVKSIKEMRATIGGEREQSI